MQKKPKLSIIIVNYKSSEHLRGCLYSLQDKISGVSFEIIVVDNSQEDLSFVREFEGCPTTLHTMKNNVGFARACNFAAKRTQAPFFVFLNPDTELLTENMKEVIQSFEENGRLGVIGAQLIDAQKQKTQSWSVGRFTNMWDILLNNMGIVRSRSLWESTRKIHVDWVSGAALFVRAQAYKKVRGFDEDFFMYFEDQDFCRRMKQSGYFVEYDPQIKFLHEGAISFSKEKSKQKKYYYASQDRYLRKYYGRVQELGIKLLRRLFT